jgi:hypothetical protein
MENISRDNYEAFLLDYLEGRLDAEKMHELRTFAITHPELGIDLEDSELAYLPPETGEAHFNKKHLFKTEDDVLVKDELLNYFEGGLTLGERKSFEEKLEANRELAAELNLLRKTRLEPDLSVVFNRKSRLKKGARIIALDIRVISRIAAAVLLVAALGVVRNLYRQDVQKAPATAQVAQLKRSKPGTNVAELRNDPAPENAIAHPATTRHISATKVVAAPKKNMPAPEPAPVITSQKPVLTDPVTTLPEEQNLVAQNVNEENKVAILPAEPNAIAVVEETPDDDEAVEMEGGKKSFWKKAVQFAHRANNLGVSSIDGHETGRNQFRLSFNSFSVEKK